MPRAAFFSKETIIENGLAIVREQGIDALSARSLSKKLGCSMSPIFTVYENMDVIKADVYMAAKKVFEDYVSDVTDYVPAFKEFGMRIVKFAKQEKQLYTLLFLHKGWVNEELPFKAKECLQGIEKAYNISPEQSTLLFRQIWPFSCGLAVMSSQDPDSFPDDEISEMISFQFASIMMLIKSGKEIVNIQPKILGPGETIQATSL